MINEESAWDDRLQRGVMMPMLMRLSEQLDGMPGRRRNWIVERS